MKGKWMKIVRQYTIITLGISMMAVGVYFFKFPFPTTLFLAV